MSAITNQAPLAAMRAALEQHRAGALTVESLVRAWLEQAPGLSLPPRFAPVMDELLRRLEMSAVFAQDSCSFSSSAIADQLALWLDRAGAA